MRKKNLKNKILALVLALLVAPPAFGADAPAVKNIELEWDPVEKASGYEVRLTPVGGGKALKYFTDQPKIQQDVPVGNYKLQIRSRSEDADIFSPWSETLPIEIVAKEITPLKPEDNSIIPAVDANKYSVDFEWKPVEGVKEYTIKVWNDKRKETPWVFVTKNPKKRLDVPPGEVYHWQVLFESATGISYAQDPATFKFTLLGAKLTTPGIGPQQLNPETQVLEWEESPGAQLYKVKLFYRHIDETEWTPVDQTETPNKQWSFHKLKRGAYKIEVTATAPRRSSSDPATFEFLVKPSDAELRQAMNKR